MSDYRPETICVQGATHPETASPARFPSSSPPPSSTPLPRTWGSSFDLEASGYFYTRLQNPTNDAVAAKISQLEGGTAAMLTSSGQAANFYAVFNIAGCGDHVVASSTIYGGTYNLFHVTMKRMGVEFTFVEPDCSEEELEASFRPQYEGGVRRDHREPGPDGAGHREVCPRGPRPRRAADCG